jgi:hypothetical protein
MKHALYCSALALFAAAAAAPVYADDITPEPPFTSTRTRAEVVAEMADFRRAGIDPWSDSFDIHAAQAPSPRTRLQATLEYLRDRAEVAGMNAEDSGSSYLGTQSDAVARRGRIDPAFDGPIMAGDPVNAQ